MTLRLTALESICDERADFLAQDNAAEIVRLYQAGMRRVDIAARFSRDRQHMARVQTGGKCFGLPE